MLNQIEAVFRSALQGLIKMALHAGMEFEHIAEVIGQEFAAAHREAMDAMHGVDETDSA